MDTRHHAFGNFTNRLKRGFCVRNLRAARCENHRTSSANVVKLLSEVSHCD